MVLIGIGSNLRSKKFGPPLSNCIESIQEIEKNFRVKQISSWYKSEPLPKSDQPWFVNGVVEISYQNNNVEKLLKTLHEIEKKFGRLRKKLNESRTLDLDILDFNSKIISTKNLTIPHPRMHKRKFVLLPIKELNKNWIHPKYNLSIENLLTAIKDSQNIIKI